MSIEARRNPDSQEDPRHINAAESTELTDTTALADLTPAELRQKMNPNRKPSILERLDTRGKKFGAGVLVFTTLVGAGFAAGKVLEGPGEQKPGGEAEPAATSLPTAGQTEIATAQPTAEVTPSVSPSNITPLETAAPTLDTKEQLIASLELSAEKYPDVASLGKAIMVDRYTAWKNHAGTQEANDEYMDPSTNKTAGDFATEKIQESADVFPKALYVENYKNIPSLVEDAATENKASEVVLERKLITWDDEVPYERSITLSDEPKLVAGSIESGKVTFTASWVDSSNAADNRIGTEYDTNDIHPYVGTRTITAVIVDGKWKISHIDF